MAENQLINVYYQETEVGRVGYDENRLQSSFQYNPDFIRKGKFKNLFPYIFRKVKNAQIFSQFEGNTFRGLPPMIADSLPDLFGNMVFKEWLEATHRNQITPLEQLAYVGNRGMGALAFIPAKQIKATTTIDLTKIVAVVEKVIDSKTSIEEKDLSTEALFNIFQIGTSAGGARPKILVSQQQDTGKLIPGDTEISGDYKHYIIKLGLHDKPYSQEKIEYVYYQLATSIGIEMMPCKLIDERHFATERFDRQNGKKQHILTASGITGWDFKKTENSNYENLFKLCVDLKASHKDLQQLFKRMVFNVVFANTDDHLKNFSFIYNDKTDKWKLAPAYDLTYPLDVTKNFLRISRALSINKKRQNIERKDLLQIADEFTIKNAQSIIKEIVEAQSKFEVLCKEQGIPEMIIKEIKKRFKSF